MIDRRNFLASSVASIALVGMPGIAASQQRKVLRIIPHGDLAVLDPHWTTAVITLQHGHAVFDTLYGMDESFQAHPQMVASDEISEDQLTWTLTLRDGLTFHDGEPVRAQDVVASVRRWAARDVLGRELLAVTEDITAQDDKTVVFRLNRPFPLLRNALGKSSATMPAIMPERLAMTDAGTQVTEVVGSGPFRFVAQEWVPGSRVVYERFDGYLSREEPTNFTSGGKPVLVDRVEYTVIPDIATAASAIMAGEVDVWDRANHDFLPALRSASELNVLRGAIPDYLVLRLNHLHPPFDNVAIRRAVLSVVNRTEYLNAMVGADAENWTADVGFFNPASPMATQVGMDPFDGSADLDAAKREIEEAGYDGTPVVILDPSDASSLHAGALVSAALFERLGFNVDLQAMDWGTLVQRRSNQRPPSEGGWNAFVAAITNTGAFDPASNFALRGNGTDAWFGWPTSARIEELRQEWLYAPDVEAQKRICEEIQLQAIEDVPYVPLGAMYSFYAVADRVQGFPLEYPRYYNVDLI